MHGIVSVEEFEIVLEEMAQDQRPDMLYDRIQNCISVDGEGHYLECLMKQTEFTLQQLFNVWQTMSGSESLDTFFHENHLGRLSDEERIAQLASAFNWLSVFIWASENGNLEIGISGRTIIGNLFYSLETHDSEEAWEMLRCVLPDICGSVVDIKETIDRILGI